MTLVLRRAGEADIAAVARLFRHSVRTTLPFLPELHTAEEDLGHFAGFLDRGVITLAEDGGVLAGLMVETPGAIHHLYLDPDKRGRGIGSALMAAAKGRQQRLELWCFVGNVEGLAFYARQGFVELRRTAGDNEEGLPDVLLGWSAEGA